MNNEQNKDTISTIHDFDFDLICEFFLNLDRQGPGNPKVDFVIQDKQSPSALHSLTTTRRVG